MTEALRFERETCSRCGGTGSYSFCEMYGSTCFKCGGKREVLTKRGTAAANWMREQRSIPARNVKPGMRVVACSMTLNVQSVEMDTKAGGSGVIDGVRTEVFYFHIRGQKATASVFPDTMVEVIGTKEQRLAQLRAAIEYQSTLTKAGKVRAVKKGKTVTL